MSTHEPPPPPPSGGGYDAAPPPPPPAPPGGGGYSAGAAWKYGWDKFVANVGQVLVAVLVLVAVQVVFQGLSWILRDQPILTFLLGLVSWVVSMVIAAGIVRFALDITEGKQLNAATLLTPHRLGEVVVASIVVGLLTFVGFVLCVIPGLVVMFFTAFTLYFLMDRPELGAIDAIKASFEFTRSNAGAVILWFLLSIATWIVGALLCGIGLIVAVPVVLIGTAYTYKTLNNEPVAA